MMRLEAPTKALLLAATLLAAVAVLLPRPAAAQSRGRPLDDPRLAPVRQPLQAQLRAAEQAGLPARWLEDKAAEGLAKHVPPPRILRAVDVLWERMQQASRMLEQIRPQWRTRPTLLRATVDALRVGAPASEVHALARASAAVSEDPRRAARNVRESLVAVAEIGERGFDGTLAVRGVSRALELHGMRGIASLVHSVRGMGASPPAGQQRALERAAERRPSSPPGHDKRAEPPHDRGGSPSDDSNGQGERRRPDPPAKGR